MSDVQTFSGHSGHNSSRVLAPPGGRSTFSFCDGSTLQPAQPVKRSTYNHNQHGMSQIPFGNAPTTTYSHPATKTTTTTTTSAMAASSTPASATAPSYSAPAAPKPRTTLRAQNYDLKVEAGKHRENVHTSSRVLAPPGGHCHNIFG